MGQGLLTSTAFPRIDGVLHCGSTPATALAERFGTPLYVYDVAWVRSRVELFRSAFREVDHLLAYSVKANGNLAVLRTLERAGCGADITSGGELYRALKAGFDPARIVFAGVGKSREEIAVALEAGILAFNVESRAELERIGSVAHGLGVVAPVALRVNPDVFASTPHEYTRTGTRETKFGVPWADARAAYQWASSHASLEPIGIDVHIGSQITAPEPYVTALDRVLQLVAELEEDGISLRLLDLGGGFGIRYDHRAGLDVTELARRIAPRIAATGLQLILEPGRALVGEAGLLLTRVEYVKDTGDKTFVIVDGGMSELIRPSHYGGYHEIENVTERRGRAERHVDVVGPICETGDFLALDRPLPLPEAGELLAVRAVGAYGFAMASNYNGRPRPAEVVVDGDEVRLARRRETLEDLIRGEV